MQTHKNYIQMFTWMVQGLKHQLSRNRTWEIPELKRQLMVPDQMKFIGARYNEEFPIQVSDNKHDVIYIRLTPRRVVLSRHHDAPE